jgi:hypothetical protein
MKTTHLKLEEAIREAELFIAQMEKMDDKKLAKHLDLFRAQMESAYRQKNFAAYELLCEYEKQVIAARVNKLSVV